MLRSELTAEASLPAILERRKFGIAIAAMIRMMATTISNSMSENPFCFFIIPGSSRGDTECLQSLCLLGYTAGLGNKSLTHEPCDCCRCAFNRSWVKKKGGSFDPP